MEWTVFGEAVDGIQSNDGVEGDGVKETASNNRNEGTNKGNNEESAKRLFK